jgi:DNA invertase Pin-like site-specific DNA recombinase
MERRVKMPKFVIYTRVSIENYLMKKQENALKEQRDKILQRLGEYDEYHKDFYSDKGIESVSSQPELNRAIDNMQPGDTLVVLSLDKLGLPLTKLIKLFIELGKKNIEFISLEEVINTRAQGELLFRVSNSGSAIHVMLYQDYSDK